MADTFAYGDESAEGFEIGAKAELFGRMMVSAAAFLTDVSDLQVQTYLGTEPVTLIQNAAETRVKGFEIEAMVRATQDLTLNLNMGYVDGKYRSFPNAPCTTGQAASGFCPNFPPTQDLSGGRLPMTPKYTFSAGFDYTRPLTDSHALAVSANVSHRSSVFLTLENDPLASSDKLTLVDARIALEPVDGGSGFTAAIVSRNLFNEKYVSSGIALPGPDSFVFQVGMPRTVELQFGYQF